MLRRGGTAARRGACLVGVLGLVPGAAAAQHAGAHAGADTTSERWRTPPMDEKSMPMLPGVEGSVPPVRPFLPGAGVDPMTLPEANFRDVVPLEDGDTLALEAGLVRRTITGRAFTMYGFNGQYPGPLIQVEKGAEVVVEFTNALAQPTTVHWHGVRLDNRYDGVPGVTQDPVAPGETFVYRVHFRDAGIYWYHPHMREDIQQDLGLYGNMLVRWADAAALNAVNREQVLTLDDLLVDDRGIFPYGRESATHALTGRFGNVFLVNGEPDYRLEVNRGEVVRFYLTNVSSTRIFNLAFLSSGPGTNGPAGIRMKVVGSDIGRFEREEWVESVVIAPAERYIVEARFETPGEVALVNHIQAVNHFLGEFYQRSDTLGTISVSAERVARDHREAFERLRAYEDVTAEIARYREHFDRRVDRELVLTVEVEGLPPAIMQFMSIDTAYFSPAEWNESMPMMNWLSTGRQVRWILREPATGRENMDIQWRFEHGDVVKIRLRNATRSLHPMSHPIHLHGQRFLVLSRDGLPSDNLVWKDTVVVPFGSTVDILLDASNPGKWMLHCHVAEHLQAGMRMAFTVGSAAT